MYKDKVVVRVVWPNGSSRLYAFDTEGEAYAFKSGVIAGDTLGACVVRIVEKDAVDVAIDVAEALVKDLAEWLNAPKQADGSWLKAYPILPETKGILAGKVAALADAISKIPTARRGRRQ
jgi:hypothetical protein